MSEKQFFNIGKNIFNKNHVVSVTQETETVEIERTIAVVHIHGAKEPIRICLPEDKTIADISASTN